MNPRTRFVCILAALCMSFLMPSACGDHEEDDQPALSGEEEEPVIRGVCYWECESEDPIQRQTICYGQGSDAITDSALETEQDCMDLGREYCDSIDWSLSHFYFDTDCLSCEAKDCRPDWLDDYGD